MTSFFAWNMRGFNKPRKHEALKKWVMETKLNFGCLLETRVSHVELPSIMQSCLPGWKVINNYDHHRLGRIWFCNIRKPKKHFCSLVSIDTKG